MMNLKQTKLVGLTMELDLKTREYKKLCNKLEQLKQSNINPNDNELLNLKELFQKNHNEIVKINRQIKELKETKEFIETQNLKQYDTANLFKRNTSNISRNNKEDNTDISVVKTEKGIFKKIIKKIKQFFSRNSK